VPRSGGTLIRSPERRWSASATSASTSPAASLAQLTLLLGGAIADPLLRAGG
jgi:hypothetical protein